MLLTMEVNKVSKKKIELTIDEEFLDLVFAELHELLDLAEGDFRLGLGQLHEGQQLHLRLEQTRGYKEGWTLWWRRPEKAAVISETAFACSRLKEIDKLHPYTSEW